MLKGINPILNGDLLALLDQMGHSDTVVIADAHFPAYRISDVVVDVAQGSPEVTAAVCSVLELDDVNAVQLMDSEGQALAVQDELVAAAGNPSADRVGLVERYAFYEEAKKANFIIRTTETRIYANVILSKGVTPSS
ncbi:RbsD/FucU family protein [Scrofimicrobium sp. R131]|uniref:RbsD/FucU domain-containing protein n=1 Tax=Scrofimicrobium appendicitidis TaxID=3079930 RepID=A0AAU7V8S7_9ACTO